MNGDGFLDVGEFGLLARYVDPSITFGTVCQSCANSLCGCLMSMIISRGCIDVKLE